MKCFCAQYNGPELIDSTSGGVFYAFAKFVIEKGGAVFGAAYDSNIILKHTIAEQVCDLKKMQGSKYVESIFTDVLPELKRRLENAQLCLFSGTPCQIAAVRAFLKKDYDNLLLIDILCHGTPSRELFKKYIDWREKKWKTKILNFEFRSKRAAKWGDKQKASITTTNGKKIIPAICDPYFSAFQKGLIAQTKCYSCKYASSDRVGDITAADFWGVRKVFPDFPYRQGVSCLLINTQKGDSFFNEIRENFILREANFEVARQYNRHFNGPLPKNPTQEQIYAVLKDKNSDFSNLLPLLPYKSHLWYFIQNLKNSIKQTIKKIIRRKL